MVDRGPYGSLGVHVIYINDEPVRVDSFPNGESHMVGLQDWSRDGANPHIRLHWDSDIDLVHLVFVAKYFRFRGPLTIEYLPYGRLDREIKDPAKVGSAGFTLRYVAELINFMGFPEVIIWEPHSQVTLDLVARSRAVYPTLALLPTVRTEIDFKSSRDYFVYPDEGAEGRYKGFSWGSSMVLHKQRNPLTGQITGIAGVETGLIPIRVGAQALIIDDLCSYGGTFVKASQHLRKMGFEQVHLLVTHLEPAAFKGELWDHVDRVFATDSMGTPPFWVKRGRLTIFDYDYVASTLERGTDA